MQRTIARRSHPQELEALRSRIDEIDAGLIDLMATRVELARKAVAVTEAAGLPREDLAREAAEVRRASTLARTRGVEPEVARDVFWRLIGLSRWAVGQKSQPSATSAAGSAGEGSR